MASVESLTSGENLPNAVTVCNNWIYALKCRARRTDETLPAAITINPRVTARLTGGGNRNTFKP
jgi:hypothetical protein